MTARTNAQPPLEEKAPKMKGPYTGPAGGIPAINQSMSHAVRHMGARRTVRLLEANQPRGYDCPSCAWPEPDPKHRASIEFCENGAKAVASEATLARADRAFFAKHTIEDLGAHSDMWMNDQGRLCEPMVLRKGSAHYEPISWDDAFAWIARHLNALPDPNRASFYTSGRTSNEAAFLYQLFVRQFGTNNLPDCSNMCHESTSFAMAEAVGIGKATVTLDDFHEAEAIFLIGQNPGTNHPRMLTTLRECSERGCMIVAVNPLDEPGSRKFAHPQYPTDIVRGGVPLAKLHVPVKINGDVAFLKGVMKTIFEKHPEKIDRHFIETYTDGYDAFEAAVNASSWEEILEGSAVERALIEQCADVIVNSKTTIICWAMGITQHVNGVHNVYEILNLLMMTGNLGKPGAGACPVRGHSNVQGDRTMGIWEKMPDTFLDKLKEVFDFEPPREHGKDAAQTVHAMLDGEIDVFVGMGGNLLSAAPDTERTAAAMKKCKLTVQIATKLNRGHIVTGEEALLLPCLGRTEVDVQKAGKQFVTVENSMCVVSKSEGHLSPASDHLKSECAIVAGLAKATLGSKSKVDWDALVADYDGIRADVERVVPGFHDYNQRVREPGGFYLGNAARDRKFLTKTGKAHFHVTDIPKHDLSGGRLLMTTIRSHDQYNTTVYGNHDRYRGVHDGRRVVFMNEEDIRERGLKEAQLVDITSHAPDGTTRSAERWYVTPYPIPRGCCATYFPEANVLVPLEMVAEKSGQPASKSVLVTIGATPIAGVDVGKS